MEKKLLMLCMYQVLEIPAVFHFKSKVPLHQSLITLPLMKHPKLWSTIIVDHSKEPILPLLPSLAKDSVQPQAKIKL